MKLLPTSFLQTVRYLAVLLNIVTLVVMKPCLAQPAAAQPITAQPAKVFSVIGEPESDITAKVQLAIDEALAAGGGIVQLPSGRYQVSETIKFAGTLAKFSQSPTQGIPLILRGGPTRLQYKGAPNRTLLDMEAPMRSTVSDIVFDGENVPGSVGIRYRAGYERGVNGGKSNTFERITLARFDVGLWIGDPFAPDLVASSFHNLFVGYSRIGVMVEGGNVAGMSFYNPIISGYEACVKLVGHTSRLIRRTPQDPIPKALAPGEPSVLVNVQTGAEIFEKDVPSYALKHRGFLQTYEGKEYYFAPGGSPEIALFNANFTSGGAVNAWVIDCNFGHIRLYTARVEGGQNFYRKTQPIESGRFADVLFDVDVTSFGGTANLIEYNNPGPLFIYGGDYHGQIALGNNTKVYVNGVRFPKMSPLPSVLPDDQEAGNARLTKTATYPGMIPQGYVLPSDSRVRRTGKSGPLAGTNLTYDVVAVEPVTNPGFVQLLGTAGAQILGSDFALQGTQRIAAGQTTVKVAFDQPMPNSSYQVSVTPGFDSGNFWVSEKTATGFTIHFKTAPPTESAFDWTLRNNPVFPAATKLVSRSGC